MQPYINLHGHSTYSILDSIGYPKQIIQRAKELGFRSIAITDHGNMNMVADMYLAIEELGGIKGIYGCEMYYVEDLIQWKVEYEQAEDKSLVKRYNHLILLAKNEKGLKNLQELVYRGFKDGYYYKPRIDRKLLQKYREGLICSTACIAGVIQQKIIVEGTKGKSYEEIKELVTDDIFFFKSTFGEDFYFEIQINELEEQKFCDKIMLSLAKDFNIKTIITNDSHYIKKEHAVARDVMMAIRDKKTKEELQAQNQENTEEKDKGEDVDCRELYLKTGDEIIESAQRLGYDFLTVDIINELFKNTLEIDEKIEKIQIDTSIKMIKPNVGTENTFAHLYTLCFNSLKEKSKNNTYIRDNYEKYEERLKNELDILKQKEIYDYFLIEKELVDYAKTQMLTGVGRGSAAGALVCYLLDITKIDPIKYNLLFFRFINPSRKELPDIDTDFEDPEVVKNYLIKKYGETNVVYISTYGTYQMKALLKDYCKVFNVSGSTDDRFFYANQLTAQIDREMNSNQDSNQENESQFLDFDDYMKKSSTFVSFISENKGSEEIIRCLYNQIRQVGKHAAGVLIVEDLLQKMPLQIAKGKVQTAYTEGLVNKNLGKMGFVKFDLLGLNTLKIINDTLKILSKEKGDYEQRAREIHPDNINFNDEKVYKLVFEKGFFNGIFQFSEAGMQELCKSVKPREITEIADIIALFRPGPLANGFHTDYIRRRFGREDVSYLHPILESISKRTYGLLVYQEQIMLTGMRLGKLSEAEANDLRKILVKMDKSLDEKAVQKKNDLKSKFIKGAIENNSTEEEAVRIWDIMEKFSGYAFNLSHSLCYAVTAFQCAYLKTYYPKEFFCSLLINTKDNDDYSKIIYEMKEFEIKIEAPEINKSKTSFTLENNSIRYGFSNIMGIGEKTAEVLEANQPYKNFNDLLGKKLGRSITKKVQSNLIFSNAFRETQQIGEILEEHPHLNLIKTSNYEKERSKIERNLLKYNVSFPSKEEKQTLEMLNKFIVDGKLHHYDDIIGSDINFYGIVKEIEEKQTKYGKPMLKVRLEDQRGKRILLLCFSESIKTINNEFSSYKEVLIEDDIIFFKGKVSYFNETKMLNLEKIYNLKKILK